MHGESIHARTVEVTWLMPRIIARSIAIAWERTHPARVPRVAPLKVLTVVSRHQSRMVSVLRAARDKIDAQDIPADALRELR